MEGETNLSSVPHSQVIQAQQELYALSSHGVLEVYKKIVTAGGLSSSHAWSLQISRSRLTK